MANPKDVMHDGYKEEKSRGDEWFTCDHEWTWHPDSQGVRDVYCLKCRVPGEAYSESIEDGVFWPAT